MKGKRRTKGLFTFANEEHGRAPRGCGDGAAGAMAFPIVNGKADFVTTVNPISATRF